ncbi:diguanylate cyclase [Bradyrhizobium liaoningense]|uniref:diguanylate cyclase n=1 Tax=Bradyrhizobium liaoningense TaxID=43992 RepID=UPI001BADBBB0|nr:diguanylate cyclase [Bradyrhizobium liaoningense]MBR0845193.1 diguanylate cyclase [Bradyrhizobium liaoningense]
MGPDEVLRGMLMYFVLPLWLAAGFANYLCHRAAHIEKTSGWKESILHLLQFAEMAVPVLAALFFEITSGVILLMIAFLILHEATAIWDVRYASAMREILPAEQHVHSVLEMLPLTGLLLVIALHWSAFTALFGFGMPVFSFTLKQHPLPIPYIVAMLVLTALLEVLPYMEELIRGLHHRTGRHGNSPCGS